MSRWWGAWSIAVAMAVTGCAPTTPHVDLAGSYLDRATVRAKQAVSVTTSVLDDQESLEFFGSRLNLVGIQPVWLKIENLGAYSYILFLKSVDQDYFSPYEAARRAAVLFDSDVDTLYRSLRDQEIEHLIAPGATVSGFVYTHLDEGLKAFSLDLVGNRNLLSFDLAVDVPGLQTDYAEFEPAAVYEEGRGARSERAAGVAAIAPLLHRLRARRPRRSDQRRLRRRDRRHPVGPGRPRLGRDRRGHGGLDRPDHAGLHLRLALPLRADLGSLSVRPHPGHDVPEGARRDRRAQPHQAMARPGAARGHAGLGRPHQPRRRHQALRPVLAADHPRDRPRGRRGALLSRAGPALQQQGQALRPGRRGRRRPPRRAATPSRTPISPTASARCSSSTTPSCRWASWKS